jgi:hypothetical protein
VLGEAVEGDAFFKNGGTFEEVDCMTNIHAPI